MIEKDYTDKHGIQRRVLVQDEYSDPAKGILKSIYLDEELKERGWTTENIKSLYNELWKRQLITAADLLKNEAPALVRAALVAVLSLDIQTLQSIAKDQVQNGRTNRRT